MSLKSAIALFLLCAFRRFSDVSAFCCGRGLPRLASLGVCLGHRVTSQGLRLYSPKGALNILRLLVSREPLFVFEFVETLFAFAKTRPPLAYALLPARPTTRHRWDALPFPSLRTDERISLSWFNPFHIFGFESDPDLLARSGNNSFACVSQR